jgi:hypothetical protein
MSKDAASGKTDGQMLVPSHQGFADFSDGKSLDGFGE